MKVIKVRKYQAGYEIRTERLTEEESNAPGGMQMKSAYTQDGLYIGSSKWAHQLIVNRGIKPELRQKQDWSANGGRGFPCSIGFCEKEQKWYGWSHRAIYGFGIGSLVVKGDCAYVPANLSDFITASAEFWKSDYHSYVRAEQDVEFDGVLGMRIHWRYNYTVPNKSLRGTTDSVFVAYPEEFGRGEWRAETLEDARQMACDFAEGVS